MTYRLVGSTDDSTDYFYLDPETGEIKVLALLTRAPLDNYRVCIFVNTKIRFSFVAEYFFVCFSVFLKRK